MSFPAFFKYQTIEHPYLLPFLFEEKCLFLSSNNPFTQGNQPGACKKELIGDESMKNGFTRPAGQYRRDLVCQPSIVTTAVGVQRLANAGARNHQGLKQFLHSHRLENENFENLVVIRIEVIHENMENVPYPFTLKTTKEVRSNVGDIFTTGFYPWDS